MTSLSILIPALQRRPWRNLVDFLEEQRLRLPNPASVELLTEVDSGEKRSGVKRQMLVERAGGDYLAFLDDDDWVSDDYLASLVKATESRPDVITFNLELTNYDNRRKELWKFHLGAGDRRREGLMEANHLCAWRRGLATAVGWCPYLGYGDDQLWYKALKISRRAIREERVNRVLYHYRYSRSITAQQSPEQRLGSQVYARGGLRVFTNSRNEILVEVASDTRGPHEEVSVVIPRGHVSTFLIKDLVLLGRIHII